VAVKHVSDGVLERRNGTESEAVMQINAWLEAAIADAERRGCPN
jgi:hypothetical protein